MRTSIHPIWITALLAGAAMSASAQSTMFVNIDGLCAFPALSWSMQAIQTPSPTQPAKTTVAVSASRTVDICSPKIYKAVVGGQHIATVKFGPPAPAHPDSMGTPILTLSGVTIMQTQINDTAPAGMPTETISFTFSEFKTQESGASSAGQTQTTLSIPDLRCTASVTSWSTGASLTLTPYPTGGSSPRTTLSTLQVAKTLDACSQQIVQAITSGTHLAQIVLTQKDSATGSILTMTIGKFGTNLITGYQVGGATNSGQPLEAIQISYSDITFSITTSAGSSQSGWDERVGKPL